jgi:copper(I)-binding protein
MARLRAVSSVDRARLLACSAVAALMLGVPGCGTRSASGVEVSRVVIPAPAEDSPAAMYAMFDNRSRAADTLFSVSSPAAERVQLHEQLQHDGGMTMQPLPMLPIPAHKRVRLAPGGAHVMLTGVRGRLTPGDSVRATFHFRNAGDVPVWAHVVSYADLERALDGGR